MDIEVLWKIPHHSTQWLKFLLCLAFLTCKIKFFSASYLQNRERNLTPSPELPAKNMHFLRKPEAETIQTSGRMERGDWSHAVALNSQASQIAAQTVVKCNCAKAGWSGEGLGWPSVFVSAQVRIWMLHVCIVSFISYIDKWRKYA